MSVSDVLTRIAQIEALAAPAVAPPAPAGAPTTSFSDALAHAVSGGAGARALAAAEIQVGQTEQPSGSNDGPAIGHYRGAVAGAVAGAPWCAYFASWAAAQGGAPLGDAGQGLGSVSAIADWARRSGRLVSTPQPGDLILFGSQHVGIVESVNADGSLTTIEGNEGDAVTRRSRSAGEATGFVRLG